MSNGVLKVGEERVDALVPYAELSRAFTDALAGLGDFVVASAFNDSSYLSATDSEGREGSTRFENKVAKRAINEQMSEAVAAANAAINSCSRSKGLKVLSIDARVSTSESESRIGYDMAIVMAVPAAQGEVEVWQPVNIKYAGNASSKNNTGGKDVLSWPVLASPTKADKIQLLEACVSSVLASTDLEPAFADYFLLSFLRGSDKPAVEWGVSSILTTPWATWNEVAVQYTLNTNQTFPSIQMAHRSGRAEAPLSEIREARERFVMWLVSGHAEVASFSAAHFTIMARQLGLRLSARPAKPASEA